MKNFVYVKEDFLPSDLCDYYVNLINEEDKKGNTHIGAFESGQIDTSFKNSIDISLSERDKEITTLLPYFSQAVQEYRDYSEIRVNTDEISEITLRKYKEGTGLYKSHIDINWGENLRRAFVILIYLNKVEKGGELVLNNHDLKIKPDKGKLVCFPCGWTWLHEACKVIKSDRYILRSFALITP